MWLSDTHIGQLGRYGVGEPAATVAYINGLAPDFAIVTGDLVNDCSIIAQFTEYKSSIVDAINAPVYSLPGNHDGSSGNHTNYISVLGPIHFTSFTMGTCRFIGIVPSEAIDLHATMPQAELDYLEAELQEAEHTIPLVFSHYPILATFNPLCNITTGAVELLALLSAYNVRCYFSGHTHTPAAIVMQDGTAHVNGDNFIPAVDGMSDCSLMVCDVSSRRIDINYRRAASPWESFSTIGISLPEPTRPQMTLSTLPTLYGKSDAFMNIGKGHKACQ